MLERVERRKSEDGNKKCYEKHQKKMSFNHVKLILCEY